MTFVLFTHAASFIEGLKLQKVGKHCNSPFLGTIKEETLREAISQ